jgi:O-methyltransferase
MQESGNTIQHRSQLPELMLLLKLPMVAVEAGVAEGNFSRDLLNLGIEKLYSVDAWETLNQRGDGGFDQHWHDMNYILAKEKLSPFGEKSIVLRGRSVEMANHILDNSCGLVYIDCDHSYEGVAADIEMYWPKLVKGGIMAFHDYESTQYGVKRAVGDFAVENYLEIHLIPENQPCDAGAWIIKP